MNLIVLAGGKSSRFGHDKARAQVKGQTLLELVVSRVAALFDRVILVVHEDSDIFSSAGYEVVKDKYKGIGPLGGLHAGLSASDSQYNFVIACDMPCIPLSLIRHMMTLVGDDVVVPRKGDLVEPLCAIYKKSIIPVIERHIEEERYRIQDVFPLVNVHYIDEDQIKQCDPWGDAFCNINTPRDLRGLQNDTDI
jgi:molybdenum cofactor guanylyltransferase